jgi:hypothetical protein
LRSTSGPVLASLIRGNTVAGFHFYLAAETGTVLMDAHAAEYDLPAGPTREVNSYQGTAASVPVTGSGGLSDGDRLRYVSYALNEGSQRESASSLTRGSRRPERRRILKFRPKRKR